MTDTGPAAPARRATATGGWPPSGIPLSPAADRAGGSMAAPVAAGGVATWLPEGRWATDPPPDDGGPGGPAAGVEADRARGRRRVAAVRVLARLAGWPRRVLAASLLLAAVLAALRPGQPPPRVAADPPPGVPVVVVTRDLPAGTTLAVRDLRTVPLPGGAVPAGAARQVRSVLGRVVAGPVRRGEPVTDARLVGPGLTAGLDPRESTAVPVRLADPETAALVRPGDRVDVLGTPVEPDAAGGAPVAAAGQVVVGVRVLAVLRGPSAADGVLLVVAAAPAAALRLAGAAARQRLTVAVRPP